MKKLIYLAIATILIGGCTQQQNIINNPGLATEPQLDKDTQTKNQKEVPENLPSGYIVPDISNEEAEQLKKELDQRSKEIKEKQTAEALKIQGSKIKKISEYATAGSPRSIIIVGNYAYVGEANSVSSANNPSLQIFDISNPATPKLIGEYKFPWNDVSRRHITMTYSNNHIFATVGNQGLMIFDVSNPAKPTLKGQYNDLNGYDSYFGVQVNGNYAYLAKNVNGIIIVDINNLSAPKYLRNYKTQHGLGSAKDIAVQGDYAYVPYTSEGLIILDISDPKWPESVAGFSDKGERYQKVFTQGQYAYVTTQKGKLKIIDISNPKLPKVIGNTSLSTPDTINEIFADDNYIYIAHGSSGLTIINVKNPSNPVHFDNRDIPGESVMGIGANGDYIFNLLDNQGLEIFSFK